MSASTKFGFLRGYILEKRCLIPVRVTQNSVRQGTFSLEKRCLIPSRVILLFGLAAFANILSAGYEYRRRDSQRVPKGAKDSLTPSFHKNWRAVQ
eukprot:sb/3479264/